MSVPPRDSFLPVSLQKQDPWRQSPLWWHLAQSRQQSWDPQPHQPSLPVFPSLPATCWLKPARLSFSPSVPIESPEWEVERELGGRVEQAVSEPCLSLQEEEEELGGGEERGAGERFWSCGEGVT